ncbi:hypothetical protein PVAG01_09504 [Phlyctema vagabunda]|uniref:Uncharacterized protein n=1 Tax=Phlyctema vagabunda TaxID=108571 RepID=A0ABR4P7I9_9HELO
MRRKTQRSVIHLLLFGGILLLVIFLNRPQTKNKTFAWNEVRYRTIANNALPKSRGICPGLVDLAGRSSNSKPILVVSRTEADGDPNWLDPLRELYHHCVYTVDGPDRAGTDELRVPANRGHEAMVYLTFLIDNYAQIPAAGVVFIHGTRWAWHNDAPDYDNVGLLATLNISAALAPWGYHNLRCDWSLSTCSPSASPQGSMETSLQAVLDPWDARAVSDAALPQALKALFGGRDGDEILGRTDTVRSQCCAQFVVARDRVWQHSRDEYLALRQWLLDSMATSDGSTDKYLRTRDAAPIDDRVAGRILSYVWHILFMSRGRSDPHTSSFGDIDLE